MHYRLIPALFLIVLGSLFLLDNLGLADLDVGHLIATWWPAFLIAAGVRQLLRYREKAAETC
ncbi:LiaI-LiaF-like domain-containing protein [Xanthomonas axonopodis]